MYASIIFKSLAYLLVFFEIYLIYKLFFKYNLCTLSYMKLHCISFVYSVHLNDVHVPIFHQFIVTKYWVLFFFKENKVVKPSQVFFRLSYMYHSRSNTLQRTVWFILAILASIHDTCRAITACHDTWIYNTKH